MSQEELPFQLIRWIRAQQEKELEHQAYMTKKNAVDSHEFFKLLAFIVNKRPPMKDREIMFIRSLMRHYETYFNFTPAQRSAIGGMYVKYGI